MPAAHPTHLPRRQTRGLRPWFLIPKVCFIAVYFGTIACALALWLRGPEPTAAPEAYRELLRQLRFLIYFIALPALGLVVVLGMALFLQCPRAFARMRWMQVKLFTIFVPLPLAQFYIAWALARITVEIDPENAAEWPLTLALCLALAIAGFLIVLGRLKPRLGQNWAQSWRNASSSANGPRRPDDS